MKNKTKRHKKSTQQIFRFLKRGYFSFPLKDKGKKFRVINTYTIYLKDKKLSSLLKHMEKYPFALIQVYEDIFWKAIKKEKLDKKFKNCWLVPIHISNLKNLLMVDIDILKPVR